MDLALNNLQRLICHKTQQTKPFVFPGFCSLIILFKMIIYASFVGFVIVVMYILKDFSLY